MVAPDSKSQTHARGFVADGHDTCKACAVGKSQLYWMQKFSTELRTKVEGDLIQTFPRDLAVPRFHRLKKGSVAQ